VLDLLTCRPMNAMGDQLDRLDTDQLRQLVRQQRRHLHEQSQHITCQHPQSISELHQLPEWGTSLTTRVTDKLIHSHTKPVRLLNQGIIC